MKESKLQQQDIFDEKIAKAYKLWLSNFKLQKSLLWLGILGLLGIVYFLIPRNDWKLVVVSISTFIIIPIVRLHVFILYLIIDILKKYNYSIILKKSFIWIMWVLSIVVVKRVGWFDRNIDNGTAIFLMYLPMVWLFKIPRAVNGFLAIIIIPFLPYLLNFGLDRTAEIWAVQLYFLLVVSTVQMAIEMYRENKKK